MNQTYLYYFSFDVVEIIEFWAIRSSSGNSIPLSERVCLYLF